jgi:hypothetical protein
MAQVIPATFDGTTFHPEKPVSIPPNTKVLLIVEPAELERRPAKPTSFIDTALSLRIDGPSDWSSRVDHYLYGNLVDGDE